MFIFPLFSMHLMAPVCGCCCCPPLNFHLMASVCSSNVLLPPFNIIVRVHWIFLTVTWRQWLFKKKAVMCKPYKSRPRKGQPPTRQTGSVQYTEGCESVRQAGPTSCFPACWRKVPWGGLPAQRFADSTHQAGILYCGENPWHYENT